MAKIAHSLTAPVNPTAPSTLELFPILQRFPPMGTQSPLSGIARLAADASPAGEGHLVELRTLEVRSILNRSVSRRKLSFAWSINPYRGCEFACRYCYARYTHEFMELRNPEDFERKIFIKQNAAWLLEQELRQVRAGEEIALGTATDPYQPVERRAKVTASLLAVLARQRGLRIGIVTKSTLIERDIPLLQKIAENNTLVLHVTITTPNAKLAPPAGTARAASRPAAADGQPAAKRRFAGRHLVLPAFGLASRTRARRWTRWQEKRRPPMPASFAPSRCFSNPVRKRPTWGSFGQTFPRSKGCTSSVSAAKPLSPKRTGRGLRNW